MSESGSQRLAAEVNAYCSWLSRLPPFAENGVQVTIKNVADGRFLWNVLQYVDPVYFSTELPGKAHSAGSWLNNLQDIKHICKHLRQYVIQLSDAPATCDPGVVDAKRVAEGGEHEDTTKLLQWVWIAASKTGNEKAIEATQGLFDDAKHILMQAHLEFDSGPQQEVSSAAQPEQAPPKISVDSELYNEEIYANLAAENSKLQAEKKALQKDLAAVEDRLTRMKENHATLLSELEKAQDNAQRTAANSSDASRISQLEAKIHSLEDHIAEQETQLTALKDKESAYEKELQRLRTADQQREHLQDDNDELKIRCEELQKTANKVEKFRARLQNFQDIERENKDLRGQLEELRIVGTQNDNSTQRYLALERQITELQSLNANIELQLVDEHTRRQGIERENAQLHENISFLDTQREQDRKNIEILESRLEESKYGNQGLDLELDEGEKRQKDGDNELEARNEQLIKTTNDTAGQVQALEHLLRVERDRAKDLQQKYLDEYAKALALEDTVMNSGSLQGSQLFKDTKAKLAAIESKAAALDQERSESQRKLAEADKLLSLVDKDQLEALEKLKDANSGEIREHQGRILTLESKVEDLTMQLDEHRKMLTQALTDRHRGAYGEEADSQKTEGMMKEIQKHNEEIERSREDLLKKTKQTEEQETQIADLKARLQQTLDKAAPELLKASAQTAMKQELDNVKRENKLMSTAFFDLSSRLQMNNVSLQRRSDAPRSFLNKQRALVNQATAVRSR